MIQIQHLACYFSYQLVCGEGGWVGVYAVFEVCRVDMWKHGTEMCECMERVGRWG